MPIIAITTSNSTSVKPDRKFDDEAMLCQVDLRNGMEGATVLCYLASDLYRNWQVKMKNLVEQ